MNTLTMCDTDVSGVDGDGGDGGGAFVEALKFNSWCNFRAIFLQCIKLLYSENGGILFDHMEHITKYILYYTEHELMATECGGKNTAAHIRYNAFLA